MAISAGMVKELRDKTGAGMMDCKSALTETSGDIEAAVDWLRTKGLAKAAKKAGRVAAEGLIGIATAAGRAAMVEVNSETDFVARNADFQKLVAGVAEAALKTDGGLAAISPRTRREHGRRGDQARGRHHRGAHHAPPRGGPLGQVRRRGHLYAQCRRSRSRQDRRPRRLRVRAARRPSSPASAARWRCTSLPRARSPSAPTSSTRRSWPASAPSSPNRLAPPASRRRSSRRWSRGGCASSTRRSSCSRRTSSSTRRRRWRRR